MPFILVPFVVELVKLAGVWLEYQANNRWRMEEIARVSIGPDVRELGRYPP